MSNSLCFRVATTMACATLLVFLCGCASGPTPSKSSESESAAPQKTASPAAAPTSATSPSAAAPAPVSAPPAEPATPPPSPMVDRLKEAAAKASAPFAGEGWDSLFDGETLSGWKETAFAGRGEVEIASGLLVLNMGNPFTGVNYTNDFPKMNYEIALDAMRVSGSDFFCGLTVPVGDSFCSLIVGGWGGALVGISSLDGMDASENETTKYATFEQGKWYRIRLRITPGRIEGWIDNEKLINVLTEGRKISTRPGDIEMSQPMGIAAWQTTAALRQIRMRKVDKPDGPPKKY